jgi:hypothetical protein
MGKRTIESGGNVKQVHILWTIHHLIISPDPGTEELLFRLPSRILILSRT